MLSGPAGRSGEDAEDETTSERLGATVRGSRSFSAVFLERAIGRKWDQDSEMTRSKDGHKEGGQR